MRLFALLLLILPAAAGDVEFKTARDLTVPDFLSAAAQVTRDVYLYPPAELAGHTMGGPHLLTLPQARASEAISILLTLANVPNRRFEGTYGLTVLTRDNSKATTFAVPGIAVPLEFKGPPARWTKPDDALGALTEASVAALVGQLRAGSAPAAVLLGFCGPRSMEVVDTLRAALQADGTRIPAAEALGRMGFAARSALPALEQLDDAEARVAAARIRSTRDPGLLDVRLANKRAPSKFDVRFHTTKGDITMHFERAWAPNGADRIYNLVRIGYYRDIAFFRVIKGFMVQFGIHSDPKVNGVWRTASIRDDPKNGKPNKRGSVTFGTLGQAHSRNVHLFINTKDNPHLNRGFVPVAEVTKGMDVVDTLYAGYGEGPPGGRGPDQTHMNVEGLDYLKKRFPKMDYIKSAEIVK